MHPAYHFDRSEPALRIGGDVCLKKLDRLSLKSRAHSHLQPDGGNALIALVPVAIGELELLGATGRPEALSLGVEGVADEFAQYRVHAVLLV